MVTRQIANRQVRELMYSAGITGPQACPRGLRHSWGVAAVTAGVPLPTVASIAATHPASAGWARCSAFGPETFVERVGDDALAPIAATRDFAYVDPDEPAAHGRIVAVRAHGPGSATLVCG